MALSCAGGSLGGTAGRGRRGYGHEGVFGGHVVLVSGTELTFKRTRPEGKGWGVCLEME